MARRLGSCAAGLAVAAVTLPRTVDFVDPCATEEGCRGMAIRTVSRCWPVSRVGLGIHTYCGITIMASSAAIHDAGVIITGTDEGRGVMTYRAVFTQWIRVFQWHRRHAGCIGTVVAGSTVIDNAGMIKKGIQKGAGYMTDTTVLGGRKVAGMFHRPYRCGCRVNTVT